MAGVLSRNITEDFLTCKICFNTFNNPKSLPCLHSFCLKCLQDTLSKTPGARGASEGTFLCPLCRSETDIPEAGLEGLKHSFLLIGLSDLLNQQKSFAQKSSVCEYCLEDGTETPAYGKCLDCEEFVCERCARTHLRSKASKEHEIMTLDVLKSDEGQNIVRSHHRVFCAAHSKEQVKFFCRSCDKAICVNCRLLDHINHECVQLEDLATEFKAEIEEVLVAVKKRVDSVQQALLNVDQLQASADDYSDIISSKIKDQSAMLHAIINSQEKQLLEQVENCKLQNQKQLQATKEGVQLSLAAIESATNYAENLVSYGNPAEIASMKSQCQQRLLQLRDAPVDDLPVLRKLVFNAGSRSDPGRNLIKEGFGNLIDEEAKEKQISARTTTTMTARMLAARTAALTITELVNTANAEASDEDKKKNKELVDSLKEKGTVKSARVKAAMTSVVRGHYSPTNPYEDRPQSVGFGATISAPHIHGYTLELLADKLKEGARCLDVGMGSGYLTACMAIMGGHTGYTVGIDIVGDLVQFAKSNMQKDPRLRALMDKNRLVLTCGDGKTGYDTLAPYDVIHVGGAAAEVPSALLRQLKPGGHLIMPVGSDKGQKLRIMVKQASGGTTEKDILNVIYQQLK